MFLKRSIAIHCFLGSPQQNGFRPHSSAELSLLHLSEVVLDALENGSQVNVL